MPLLPRPAVCLRLSQNLYITKSTSTNIAAPGFANSGLVNSVLARRFSQTKTVRGGAHEEHFEPPSGWLWGIKPGEKVEKEGWENLWVYGFFGSLALGVVGYAFKPDSSIQTWALEEARRRLEVEGILKEPESK